MTEVKKIMDTKLFHTDDNEIAEAGEILRNGGLVAFPTETVYGLGASAFDSDAAKKIYDAKGRPSDNPLIVHICDKGQIKDIAEEIPESAKKVIDNFMPGPVTIILKKKSVVPNDVTAGLDTVAIRFPLHETAQKLIKAAGVPIAAPSANPVSYTHLSCKTYKKTFGCKRGLRPRQNNGKRQSCKGVV